MQDQQAFQKIKLGDEKALAEVYIKHRDYVINWITRKHSCSLEEAKDIYQDVILIFYNNIVKGKITSIDFTIGSYLCEVAKRQFLGKVRKDSKLSRGIIGILKDTADRDIEDDQAFEEKCEMVHAGLKKLGDPCNQLIRLRYFYKLSMDVITQKLGYKNTATAKNLKYKCMQRLRKIVNEMVHTVQFGG